MVARITVVYVLARIVTGAMMQGFAAVQSANSFTSDHPSYLSFAAIWDGAWYRVIATGGYPSALPVDAAGHVTENAWAFMPAYPFLVRGLMLLTGASFEAVAVSVSLVAGLGAALVFRRLVGRFLDAPRATFATVLLCVAPTSVMFQVAYAESMGTVPALRRPAARGGPSLVDHAAGGAPARHDAADGAGVRVLPRAVPGRVVVPSRLGPRGRSTHAPHRSAPVRGRRRVRARRLAWPAIAWAVTGVPKAYTDTELAWRSSYVGWGELLPFSPWVEGFSWWLRYPGGWPAALAIPLGLAAIAVLVWAPAARRVGLELRLWVVAYVVYLLAVFFPQSSTWRILMPIAPLLAVVALPRSRVYRVVLVVVALVLQWVWLYANWWVDGYDWTPP